MIIKAISLWEPWASLMRCGAKTIETRSWYTAYRGPLLICGAKRWGLEQNLFLYSRGVQRALGWNEPRHFITAQEMLSGKAACVVDLVDCRPTESFALRRHQRWPELHFGNFDPGRYGWVTKNRRTFEPFPVVGRQGLFNVEVPDELLRVT